MNWICIRKPLSSLQVKEVEKELNIKLPDDYCEQIGKINGGALKNAYIVHPQLGTISYSRNVSLSKESKGNIFELYDTSSEEKRNFFPFGSVGNGDYFCFDLRNNQVVLWAHETDCRYYICDSYTQLLQMIRQE